MLDGHSSRRLGDLGGARGRVLEMTKWTKIMRRGARRREFIVISECDGAGKSATVNRPRLKVRNARWRSLILRRTTNLNLEVCDTQQKSLYSAWIKGGCWGCDWAMIGGG